MPAYPTLTSRLTVAAPYNFNLSIHSHRNKRYHYDHYDRSGGAYKMAIELHGRPVLVDVRSGVSVQNPALNIKVTGKEIQPADLKQIKEKLRKQFLVDLDLKKFYSALRHDAVMKNIFRRFYGLKPNWPGDLFECIVRCIISQQISVHVADKVEMEFVQRFGRRLEQDGEIFYAFPSSKIIAGLDKGDLRKVKFSERKAEYVIDLARSVVSGIINLSQIESLPAEEFRKTITEIRGIGHWTAECCLMHLGHYDIFPKGDLGLHQAVRLFYGFKKKIGEKETIRLAKQWKGWEALATYYLWHALTHERQFEKLKILISANVIPNLFRDL